ncbi:PREDICTED: mavicyanin [Fragaria vesca subsp. vesca]|uniref:mavicyanin n=1 Tax=Fragaria vesca subsp. vesca TaxID=101020 RepID=UPI0002C31721|nr:PREDICTED: mavicyanin [Fragaria vesca subsp. vesca]
MAKLLLVCGLVALGFALTCYAATTYTVGGNSGWDISTDLPTWASDKKFVVGDVLWFQYSSSNSVNQVTKENYEGCNTTNVVKSYTGGNTTVTLTRPGDWYFVSGNKLYCLGGMKLQVPVQGNQLSYAPASAPQSSTGPSSLPNPSSKSDIPTSAGLSIHGGSDHVLVLSMLGTLAAMLWM